MHNDLELARVFATDEMALFAFAKSLLDRDGIEYMTKNETLKNVEGWTMSGWIDVVRGPAEVWVRSEDAERARSLLDQLSRGQDSGNP